MGMHHVTLYAWLKSLLQQQNAVPALADGASLRVPCAALASADPSPIAIALAAVARQKALSEKNFPSYPPVDDTFLFPPATAVPSVLIAPGHAARPDHAVMLLCSAEAFQLEACPAESGHLSVPVKAAVQKSCSANFQLLLQPVQRNWQ